MQRDTPGERDNPIAPVPASPVRDGQRPQLCEQCSQLGAHLCLRTVQWVQRAMRGEDGGTMRDWLYPVDPKKADRDGVPPRPDRYLRLAEAGRASFWGLRAKRHIEPGDRLWVYFKLPLGKVAAMAEVEREPYEIDNDPDGFLWEFPAVLNLDATRALNRDPVPLSALSNQRPQGVGGVSGADLVTFLRHAGM